MSNDKTTRIFPLFLLNTFEERRERNVQNVVNNFVIDAINNFFVVHVLC